MRYFPGHGGFVQAVAFSPDGRVLASGGADGSARLWGVVGATEEGRFTVGPEWVGAVAFSPDGRVLCSASHDGELHFWDIESRALADSGPAGERGRITAVAFSPDGKRLGYASYGGGGIWALRGKAAVKTFKDGNGLVFALRIAPDGQTFATGGTGRAVLVRRLADLKEVQSLPHGDRQGCWSLAYAPNGKTLAVALGGGVQLWDVASGRRRGGLADHGDIVSGVAFSPDGGRLLTCGWDGVARLYAFDPAAGAVVRELGRYDWKLGQLFDVAISPDGTLAAAAGNLPPYLVVWDVE